MSELKNDDLTVMLKEEHLHFGRVGFKWVGLNVFLFV